MFVFLFSSFVSSSYPSSSSFITNTYNRYRAVGVEKALSNYLLNYTIVRGCTLIFAIFLYLPRPALVQVFTLPALDLSAYTWFFFFFLDLTHFFPCLILELLDIHIMCFELHLVLF